MARVRWSLLVCCLLLALGCRGGKDPGRQPDILVVLISGWRADTPGQPGAEAALLEAFAEAPRHSFAAAYSQSLSPHLSLGSALTGLYPSALPLCGFADFGAPSLEAQPWCAALPAERASLPEALAAYGWRTAFLHTSFLEQEAYAGRFQHERALEPLDGAFATDWALLAAELSSWWKADARPRLAVLGLADPMGVTGVGEGAGSLGEPAEALARYREVSRAAGPELAALVEALERSSRRPLLVVLSAPHGLVLRGARGVEGNATQRMAPALLEERSLHVPLHFLGSAVQRSERHAQPVELRAVLPTLLLRVGAALPAGVEPVDLLASPPALSEPAYAYAELGDMLALRQDRWLLRFRTLIHHGTALNSDLTGFLMHPPADPLGPEDLAYYHLYDLGGPQPERDVGAERPEVLLALRERMVQLRTGPAAPHPKAMEPERLLELRMTASDGYW
jgi:hypothetical protein